MSPAEVWRSPPLMCVNSSPSARMSSLIRGLPIFFAYFETVRIKYLGEVMHSGLLGTELLDLPLILVDASCTYKSPALLTEILHIGTGVSRFGTKSFDMLYRVQGEDGRLIAYGKTVQVMYDYITRSAFSIPDGVQQFVARFQAGWEPPAYP